MVIGDNDIYTYINVATLGLMRSGSLIISSDLYTMGLKGDPN